MSADITVFATRDKGQMSIPQGLHSFGLALPVVQAIPRNVTADDGARP
jgi:hypothetical protein